MAPEVYSHTKPAAPYRAGLSAAALLVLATILALQLSSKRAGDPLGPRFEVPGGSVSFRPPRGFSEMSLRQTNFGIAFVFKSNRRRMPAGEFTFHILQVRADTDAATVARGTMPGQSFVSRLLNSDQNHEGVAAPLGRLMGYQRVDVLGGRVSRAAVLPSRNESSRDAFAAVLRLKESALTEDTLRLFDEVCQTFEFRDR